MTLFEHCIDYLNNNNKNIIYLKDFLNEITKRSGCSKESVRCSTIGHTADKFLRHPYFLENYIYKKRCGKDHARIIKIDYAKKYNIQSDNVKNYNTIEKKKARFVAFSGFEKFKIPKILTMCGKKGYDAEYIFSKNQNAKIFNVEKLKDIYNSYKKTKIGKKTINYNCSMNDFIKNYSENFDFIYYDSIGYLCQAIYDDLLLINKNKITKNLSLCIMDIKKFRNHGSFATQMRKKYKNSNDPTRSCIIETLSNYKLIKKYTYKQTEDSQRMQILKFRLVNS